MRIVAHEVKCLSNMIRQELDGNRKLNSVTIMQGMFIGYLTTHSGIDQFQKDLETQFQIRRSTATGILQLMERDGLIVREPVEHDARLKRLVLTEKADAIFHQMNENLVRVEDKLVDGLSEEELNTFFSIMDKMKHNLETSKEEDADD